MSNTAPVSPNAAGDADVVIDVLGGFTTRRGNLGPVLASLPADPSRGQNRMADETDSSSARNRPGDRPCPKSLLASSPVLRMSYPTSTIYLLAFDRTRFDRVSLLKMAVIACFRSNGKPSGRIHPQGNAPDPREQQSLSSRESRRRQTRRDSRFSIYLFLPLNQKYVKFLPKGKSWTKTRPRSH